MYIATFTEAAMYRVMQMVTGTVLCYLYCKSKCTIKTQHQCAVLPSSRVPPAPNPPTVIIINDKNNNDFISIALFHVKHAAIIL